MFNEKLFVSFFQKNILNDAQEDIYWNRISTGRKRFWVDH